MKINYYVDYYLKHHKNPYLRIAMWGVLFMWLFWAHGWFETGDLPRFVVLFFWCLANLVFYYIFSRIVYPAIRGTEWVSVILWCLVLYILSVCLMRLPYNVVLRYRPELGDTSPYNLYSLNSVGDVFSKTSIVVLYVGAAWVNLVTLLLFAMRRVLLASKARQESLQARNATEVGFLRAQVQPHFLFNTLNNIYGLLIEQEQASRMVLQLSDLLRYTLYNTHTPYVALEDEVGFMSNYLELEATRLQGEGIEINHNLSGLDKHGMQITPLLLIQVVEYVFRLPKNPL